MHRHMRRSRKGFALTMALVFGVLAALAAYANLMLAVMETEQSGAVISHARARYAAEAGYVIAKERLWANPNYCTGANLNVGNHQVINMDTNGDGTNDLEFFLWVVPCDAGQPRRIQTQVVF